MWFRIISCGDLTVIPCLSLSLSHQVEDLGTLMSLVTQYPTKGKAVGGARMSYKVVAPSAPSAELQQPSTSSSECSTSHMPIMVSSEESDSESSFADSNDSEDERETTASLEVSRAKHSSRIGGKQVTPPKNSSSATKTDTKASSSSDAVEGGEKEDLPPGWTGAEVTHFRLLHPIFGHNYCVIAELLQTKKCQEVYEYSQRVSGTLLLGQPERVRRLAGKKKKRNMRFDLPLTVVYPSPFPFVLFH